MYGIKCNNQKNDVQIQTSSFVLTCSQETVDVHSFLLAVSPHSSHSLASESSRREEEKGKYVQGAL